MSDTTTPDFKPQVKHLPLEITKTIYTKRCNHQDILSLEIETHLRKYPDFEFTGVGKPVRNNDRSLTYTIHFKEK